jgi:hypothetical protein
MVHVNLGCSSDSFVNKLSWEKLSQGTLVETFITAYKPLAHVFKLSEQWSFSLPAPASLYYVVIPPLPLLCLHPLVRRNKNPSLTIKSGRTITVILYIFSPIESLSMNYSKQLYVPPSSNSGVRYKENDFFHWVWWCMPVIPGLQEDCSLRPTWVKSMDHIKLTNTKKGWVTAQVGGVLRASAKPWVQTPILPKYTLE